MRFIFMPKHIAYLHYKSRCLMYMMFNVHVELPVRVQHILYLFLSPARIFTTCNCIRNSGYNNINILKIIYMYTTIM